MSCIARIAGAGDPSDTVRRIYTSATSQGFAFCGEFDTSRYRLH
jgi:hypothetical protein